MAMEAADIERLIRAAFPGAPVEITDLAGDGNHYAATVVGRGVSRPEPGAGSTSWSMPR